ncbi:MAG: T9SS type A sorting domain-containing protein, partial [Bacteroidetes bacterium]|nr:T9SS type A sorting domain-containing protein [Bacteroidota bacterium]
DGYEVRLPRNVLGLSDDAPVQLFAVYTSDTGFLSNQFISPAGPEDGNFGDGPVDFGQAVPDPVTVAADQLDGSAAGDKATDTRPAAETPEALVLHGNYPNPFNPTTTIRFDLPEAATVRVEVLDVTGRRMLSVPGQSFAAGTGHRVTLDAGHLPSGLYLYRVVAEGATALHQQTGRMVLIK